MINVISKPGISSVIKNIQWKLENVKIKELKNIKGTTVSKNKKNHEEKVIKTVKVKFKWHDNICFNSKPSW